MADKIVIEGKQLQALHKLKNILYTSKKACPNPLCMERDKTICQKIKQDAIDAYEEALS